jgi:hypothetical protein
MPIYRVISRDASGVIQHVDYKDLSSLLKAHEQVGVEEDSYTLRLHGEPILKGLIGPMSQGKSCVCYETPDAFVVQTEKWAKERRSGRRSSAQCEED